MYFFYSLREIILQPFLSASKNIKIKVNIFFINESSNSQTSSSIPRLSKKKNEKR